jgi:hypothetical protein
MHPDNIGQQFEEHVNLLGKLSKLDARFGDNYSFKRGDYHDPDNGTYHTVMISHNPHEWAGEIEHDEQGHVGHMYVQQAHRAGLPSLIMEASRVAHAAGGELPKTGGAMTPKAERLFKNQLPIARQGKHIAITPPINTYGD